MANYEATRYDWDGAFLTGVEGVNTGVIVPWSSASIPSGFLECNGQAVSQATYAALFAIIGTTYGNPGGGNFNVPDLTDRTVVNKSNTKNLAQTGGANTVAPTGNISANAGNTTLTTPQMPSHTHQGGLHAPASGTNMAGVGGGGSTGNAGSSAAHNHNVSATFSGAANSVLQPFLVVVYIIKT
jgi:microcystin-dependent protein